MPPKKQKFISQSSIGTKPCLKATPQRKSCRKTVLNSKNNGSKKSQINDIPVKNCKVYLKNMKVKDISNQSKFKENSSEPIENDISFEISVQNKTVQNSTDNDDKNPRINEILNKSCKVLLRKMKIKDISNIKLNENLSESSGDSINFGIKVKNEKIPPRPPKFKVDIFEENKIALSKSDCCSKSNSLINNSSDLDSKYQRKSKRKTIGLNKTDHAYESPKKPKMRIKAKNGAPKEEINIKCQSNLSIVKNEIDFPSALDASPSSVKDESVLEVLTQHEFKTHLDVNSFPSKECMAKLKYDESSSDSDWEEVEECEEHNLENYNPVIPKEGVEITVGCPQLNVRKKRKEVDKMEHIRLQINRELREQQLNTHKTHLLCLLAHGLSVNNILNSPILKALALSVLPNDILALTSGRKINKINTAGIKIIVSWFQESFKFENKQLPFISIEKSLISYFQEQKSLNASEYNLMFIVVARTLGLKTRFCVSFYPLTHKAKHVFKKNKSKNNIRVEESSSEDDEGKLIEKVGEKRKPKAKKKDIHPSPKKSKSRPKRSTKISYKISGDESDNDDEDFDIENEEKFERTKRTSVKQKIFCKRSKKNIFSNDSEPLFLKNYNGKLDHIVCWCEVFSQSDKQWISVECSNNIISEPYNIEKLLLKTVTYIVAYDNESYAKDVTRRYCKNYMTSTLKMRAVDDWWKETLEPFSPPNSKQNKEEEKKLDDMLINKPLPKIISEYKNHPLYALKRHLLKFEAIYPPDAAPVGFLREEPIYARDCVCKLKAREKWGREARIVRIGEEPYKIVKCLKWDKINRKILRDVPLEIFGFWQTGPYEPPTAVDGKVPRNEYGNVELFKPCMLPKGTVHLQIPGLNRVAKKLGIDCSQAVTGFDGDACRGIFPVFDGFVVCTEFKDILLAAWEKEQENSRKRLEEKREKRIYGNWKKLIRGLLIRERIKLKYDVN